MPIFDEHHPDDTNARSYPPSLLLWSHNTPPITPLLLKEPSLNYLSMLEVITKSEVQQSAIWLLSLAGEFMR